MSRRNGLRDRWLPHVLNGHTGAGYGCRLMLTVMHSRMTDKGYVSIPRTELAGILGVHPSRVTAWTKEAIAAGLLQKVGGGYHGRTAEFAAVIPTPKVSANKSPSVGKVPVFESPKTSHLSAVQTGHEGERNKSPNTRALLTKPARATATHLTQASNPTTRSRKNTNAAKGKTHRPRVALPPHQERGYEVDALSEVRVASFSNVD